MTENLQCMIKEANPFSYNQNFAPPPPPPAHPPGLSALIPGLYTCIKSCNLFTSSYLKKLDQFSSDFTLCQKTLLV